MLKKTMSAVMVCPVCGKRVTILNPGNGCSAWYMRHVEPGRRVQCSGSYKTAGEPQQTKGAT